MNLDKNKLLNDTINRAVNIGVGLEPMDHLEDFFAQKLMIIGTAANEKYTSLAGLRKLIENQQEQTKGMNLRIARSEVYRDFSADENVAIIVEDIVIFISTNSESIQLDVRASAVLEFKNQQWKLIHWHVSKPDHVESEVDTFGIEQWKQKAAELENLVAERTASLVEKNRALEIEAALERVRTVAMSMRTPDDLLNIAEVLFNQLRGLGFGELRNAMIHAFFDEEKQFIDYDFSHFSGGRVTRIPYTGNPVVERFIRDIRKANDSFTEIIVADSQLDDWKAFRKANGEIDDPRLEAISSLHYYHYSIGTAAIGISTFQPVSAEQREVLKRFRNAFDFAYQRYTDVAQAEAQAVQAQLDLIQIQTEKARAEGALTELHATQAQLIQKEKLASLGELTAGIAHEIQNPLNFVNNFSEVSAELLAELEEERQKSARDPELEAELLGDLKQNLQKITHHGQRASGIVRGMLEHARSSTGERQPTDLNALADEYLRLACLGFRAKNKEFTGEWLTEFDPDLPLMSVIPPDLGRVLLNLFNNAFYAIREKQKTAPPDYRPTVTVSTGSVDDGVEIRVRDNGIGIPESVKAKIFQPFFTTKPTGEGTGLGLSLSYDIITKGHGGSLTVESRAGEGTVFVIGLPLTQPTGRP